MLRKKSGSFGSAPNGVTAPLARAMILVVSQERSGRCGRNIPSGRSQQIPGRKEEPYRLWERIRSIRAFSGASVLTLCPRCLAPVAPGWAALAQRKTPAKRIAGALPSGTNAQSSVEFPRPYLLWIACFAVRARTDWPLAFGCTPSRPINFP